jgi:flavin-binding protein dodecin
MDKVFVAQRIAKKLGSTEAAIDAALVEASELMADVLKAPQEVGVSSLLADPAQAKVMEAIKALSEARTAVVAAHNAAYEAKLRVGIRTKLLIDGRDSYHIEADPVTMSDQRRAV